MRCLHFDYIGVLDLFWSRYWTSGIALVRISILICFGQDIGIF